MMGAAVGLTVVVLTAFAGAITHELAHWLVWRVSGRRPRLDLWGLAVQPRAGPARTTRADRVAAAAPYVLGLSCVAVGLELDPVLLTWFGMWVVGVPSVVDMRTIIGRTTWEVSAAKDL